MLHRVNTVAMLFSKVQGFRYLFWGLALVPPKTALVKHLKQE